MPFGAVPLADGGARFALWAPAVERVGVVFETPGRERQAPLAPGADGWFRGVVADAEAGERYRYELDGGARVADPASRFQPDGAEGASELVDPEAFDWPDAAWRGRPFEEAVFYELHVGAFTPRGDYGGVAERLDHLAELGVTALELMPLSECPGARNWGYDGVLPFAPASRHGRPDELKALVAAAHERELMVFLDVVYNHFGPAGNELHRYAPDFFTSRHETPWGDAIDFESATSRPVREYFIHNALYWLEEYHLDGLRLDAVHAIRDDSRPDVLDELAQRVRDHFAGDRRVHLVLENDDNAARRLARDPRGRPLHYTAQWNDDLHHGLHVLLTGEREGYYEDYADEPVHHLGRSLAEGFAYQGDASRHRGGAPRGEPSGHLPPTAFVGFLQNHDQVGNRAFGERIARLAPPEAVAAALHVLLLSPSPPLLFMGEEWGAEQPFLFFCDFEGELAAAVRRGRRSEFARFPAFRDPATRERIPDPCDPATFESSRLCWEDLAREPHRGRLERTRRLLEIRRREIAPLLAGAPGGAGRFEALGSSGLRVSWQLGGAARLVLIANLSAAPFSGEASVLPEGERLASTPESLPASLQTRKLPAWSAGSWLLGPTT
ncbi:MAG: malto-oligosyltrehalose trehalohydrolase [Myxococcota bacterium]|nr:malto-oligosyltrehalose trehalohydrolase [Myxococcota bacterium]